MRKFRVNINGRTFEVEVEEVETSGEDSTPQVKPGNIRRRDPAGARPHQESEKRKKQNSSQPPDSGDSPSENGSRGGRDLAGDGKAVSAPLPGTITSIEVEEGQAVDEGDLLFVLEAMKMENEITAPSAGSITTIRVEAGETVSTDQVLALIT